MSDVHYFQRYSQRENVTTNNTLLLFSRLYNNSPSKFRSFLEELLEHPDLRVGIMFSQQSKGKDSIPDASITQTSFHLLVETKRHDDQFSPAQLKSHATSFKDVSVKILLLLSPETISQSRINDIRREITKERGAEPLYLQSASFNDIIEKMRDVIDPYDVEMKRILEDYSDYCASEGLLSSRKSIMRVVPCGKSIEDNFAFNIYYAPSDRPYSQHSYLGIYKDKVVQGIGKIICLVDANLEENGTVDIIKCYKGNVTDEIKSRILNMIPLALKYGWEIKKGHRFFCVDQFYRTDFKKTSPGGIMGPRFFDLTKYITFKEDMQTDKIAEMLNGKTWE